MINMLGSMKARQHKIKNEKKGRGRAPVGGGMIFASNTATSVIKAFEKEFPYETAPSKDDFAKTNSGGSVTDTSGGVAQFMAVQIYRVLHGKEKPTNALFWPWFGTRSFFERVVIPTIQAQHEKIPYENWREVATDLKNTFPDTIDDISTDGSFPLSGIRKLAEVELRTALELQFTEEVVYLFKTLKKQAPCSWVVSKNGLLSQTQFLTSHMALSKLSVAEKFAKESVSFLKGIYDSKNPQQVVNARVERLNRAGQSRAGLRLFRASEHVEATWRVCLQDLKKKLFLSQYKGMQIERLACDAFIVDEVRNFNRAFNKVPKGTMVPSKTGKKGDQTPDGNKARIHVKGRPSRLINRLSSTPLITMRIGVQNFISVALYFQRGRV